ncbi:MAG: cell division protein FtsZ [Tannerella sp.]|jgi:cell division protein FtsZ|nr:cell division protein FtsZ [Tannerella sp.]
MNEENNKLREIIPFKFPTETEKIIKVIGVGGGGGNAVKHMYNEGIHDVSFVLCNTDWQHMKDADVPVKIVLGTSVTKGLGAGNDPQMAEKAALESEPEIRSMLSDGTRMAFITAAMGGGTGTGAAPVVARIAREMGILTVGIVTIPFRFEGYDKIIQALDGVTEMSKNVDALLVVNNERLIELELYWGSLFDADRDDVSVSKAFAKANDTLTVAAKSISELITLTGTINLDFADVNTILKNGGIALVSTGYGQGKDRLQTAIRDALNAPLLSYNDIVNAKKILFQITSSSDKRFDLGIREMKYIQTFMNEFEKYIKVIWGLAYDDSLGETIKFTVLVSGFGVDDILTDEEWDDISKKKDRKEIEKEKEERAKKEAEIRKRIAKYYNLQDEPDNLMERIVILTAKEMDNDTFIHWLEEHPVCNRTQEEIAEARRKNVPDATSSAKPSASSPSGTSKSIRF